MDWVNIVFGFVTGGGIVSISTIPALIKKAKAEARAAEIDNIQKVAESWKQLSDERQQETSELKKEIEEKNSKIDELFVINSDWRDKYNTKCEEITDLRVRMATNEVRLCQKRGCPDREPQTGY